MLNFVEWLTAHEAALKELWNALESAAALEPNVVNILHQLFGHVADAKAQVAAADEAAAPAKKGKASAASADTAA